MHRLKPFALACREYVANHLIKSSVVGTALITFVARIPLDRTWVEAVTLALAVVAIVVGGSYGWDAKARLIEAERDRKTGEAESREQLLALQNTIDEMNDRARRQEAEGRSIRTQIPQHRTDLFVGRKDLKLQLSGLLQDPKPVVLTGPPGIGKSELAANLADELSRKGKRFERGLLWTSLGPEPDQARLLWDWLRAIDPNTEYGLNSAAEELRAAISAAVTHNDLMPPTLVVIDDVWTFADTKLFIDAVGTGRFPILLTTHERNVVNEAIGAGDIESKPVPELSKLERLELVKRVLAKLDGNPNIDEIEIDDATKEAIDTVGGVPFFLIQIAAFGADHGFDADLWQTAKREAIGRNELYRRRLARLENDEWLRLLEGACALLPSFTPREIALITELLDGDSDDDAEREVTARVSAELNELVARFFLEETKDGVDDEAPDDTPVTDVRYGFYRPARETTERYFQERHEATDKQNGSKATDGKAIDAYHERGAAYWGQVLNPESSTSQNASSYKLANQRESPEWHRAAENWIHHLQHLPDRSFARLAFNSVYFELFWWWGNYVQYEFLGSLVSEQRLSRGRWGWEGEDAAEDENSKGWINAMVQFDASYPAAHPGGFPAKSDRTSQEWKKVKAALDRIRKIDGLDKDTPADTPDEHRWDPAREHMHQHTRALIEVFLAHCERYGGGTPEEVDSHYEEALRLLRGECSSGKCGPDCSWNIPWVLSEQADTAIDRFATANTPGLLEQALEKTREATRRVLEPASELLETEQQPFGAALDDYEVIASCCRARGDIEWKNRQHEQALEWYNRAGLIAYAWQYDPRTDPYTRAFYGEMIAHLLERIRSADEQTRRLLESKLSDFHKTYATDEVTNRDAGWLVLQRENPGLTEDPKELANFEPPPDPRKEPAEPVEDKSRVPRAVKVVLESELEKIWEDATAPTGG